jgi:DNA-binding transcriptional regulator GbsR (MarR family)
MSATKQTQQPRRKVKPPHPFVERLALALETDGFPRIAGRIFGYLLMSDSEISLDEIAQATGASKASASVNTRMLEEKGFIERVGRPADRRDYYRIAADPFLRTLEQRLARWNRIRSVITDAMNDASLTTTTRGRLREFDSMSGECGEPLEAALMRMKNRRKR